MKFPWYYGKLEYERFVKGKEIPSNGFKMKSPSYEQYIWKPTKFNMIAVFIMGVLQGRIKLTWTIHWKNIWNKLLWRSNK